MCPNFQFAVAVFWASLSLPLSDLFCSCYSDLTCMFSLKGGWHLFGLPFCGSLERYRIEFGAFIIMNQNCYYKSSKSDFRCR